MSRFIKLRQIFRAGGSTIAYEEKQAEKFHYHLTGQGVAPLEGHLPKLHYCSASRSLPEYLTKILFDE
jgi:hypothetical protein